MATTATNVNLENLRRSYKAFGAGDMGTLSELLSDETVWHILRRNPLSADYKGKDAVFGFFWKAEGAQRGHLHVGGARHPGQWRALDRPGHRERGKERQEMGEPGCPRNPLRLGRPQQGVLGLPRRPGDRRRVLRLSPHQPHFENARRVRRLFFFASNKPGRGRTSLHTERARLSLR
jgi:hypothetical protein